MELPIESLMLYFYGMLPIQEYATVQVSSFVSSVAPPKRSKHCNLDGGADEKIKVTVI